MDLNSYLKIINTEAQRQRKRELQNQENEATLLAEADKKLKEMYPRIKQLVTILNECHCSGLSIPKSSTEMTFMYVGENPGLSTQTDMASDRTLHIYIYDDRKHTLLRKVTEDGKADDVTAKDVELFLLDFVRYENLIYQWLEQLAYSHQKKIFEEIPAPDDETLLNAVETRIFYSIIKDSKTGEKVVSNKKYYLRKHDYPEQLYSFEIKENKTHIKYPQKINNIQQDYHNVVCLPLDKVTEDTPCGRYLDMTYEELSSKLSQNQAITMH